MFVAWLAGADCSISVFRNVQVTLQILTALMEKVPRDLPIYARYVLSVLDTVLRSQDISMVEDSVPTFETFCQHQDMASLAAEQELSTQYQGVVRTYAGFADTKPSSQSKGATSSPMSIRWRNTGLQAIKGVVSSDATLAADGGDSLKLILPVILQNLYTGEEDVLVLLQLKSQEPEKTQQDLAPRRRVSAATVQTVDATEGDPVVASQSAADADRKAEMDARLLALRCLEQVIVSGSSRGQIRVTTMTILRFILGKAPISGPSQDGTWATSLMELVAKWCPVQVRFLIMNAAVEVLLEINPTETNLTRSLTMVSIIDWLLKSSVNMIGLSVMDVLVGLMHHTSSALSPSTESATNGEFTEKEGSHVNGASQSIQRQELLDLLVQSIGHLATHIYYGEQITDMVRTILNRVKPSTTPEHPTTTVADNSDVSGAVPKSATPGEANAVTFSSETAKVTALKAVKNTLTVASGKKPMASAGVESRNQVGVQVWEDTQWLLRDQPDVRIAYSNALLTWLNLETNENDLRIREPTAKPLPKRELPEIAEKPGKRAASASVSHREKAVHIAQSSFLRLLHLTIYEHALEHPTEESEILLLHLLLTTLVERLGVNAVRLGLPMILKLQNDAVAVENPYSAVGKVNIGSLVFGYLWKLTEKFSLDVFRVGGAILGEIDKRKKFGVWLDSVHIPPVNLDGIAPYTDKEANHDGLENPDLLRAFGEEVYELVDRIEEVYNTSIKSPPQSPPSSPERGAKNGPAKASQKDRLPPAAKDEMLSEWSKETCLAAVQKDKAKSFSVNCSKANMARRSLAHINGTGDSSNSTITSPTSAQWVGSGSFEPGTAAGFPDRRRVSIPESPSTPLSSNRASAVRVNDLRRVLSTNNEANSRGLSPLRGRLDPSTDDAVSSSSESMVSGFSVSEVDGEGTSSKPQSIAEGETIPDGDGMETPRASTFVLSDGLPKTKGVPPVPPLPSALNLPGGFPSDSSVSSTPASERPGTAPFLRKQTSLNGVSGAYHASRPSNSNTLDKRKSRSSTGLATVANAIANGDVNGDTSAAAAADEPAKNAGGYTDYSQVDGGGQDANNLLNEFLSKHDAEPTHGKVNGSRRTRGGISARKSIIGRPPY